MIPVTKVQEISFYVLKTDKNYIENGCLNS